MFRVNDNDQTEFILSELLPEKQYFFKTTVNVRDDNIESGYQVIKTREILFTKHEFKTNYDNYIIYPDRKKVLFFRFSNQISSIFNPNLRNLLSLWPSRLTFNLKFNNSLLPLLWLNGDFLHHMRSSISMEHRYGIR